jgi:hypothetical protein
MVQKFRPLLLGTLGKKLARKAWCAPEGLSSSDLLARKAWCDPEGLSSSDLLSHVVTALKIPLIGGRRLAEFAHICLALGLPGFLWSLLWRIFYNAYSMYKIVVTAPPPVYQ